MEQLIEKMKVLLASSFAFYLKAQNYHWNVEGPNFAQYHDFLGGLYKEIQGSIDITAEQIRALGAYSPGSFTRYLELSVVKDEMTIPDSREMLFRLKSDNDSILALLVEIDDLAGENKKAGLQNYIQERIDIHSKHAWMISSFLK